MEKPVLIEAIHLEIFIPRDLPEEQADAVRHALDSRRFRAKFSRSVRAVINEFEGLRAVKVRITR